MNSGYHTIYEVSIKVYDSIKDIDRFKTEEKTWATVIGAVRPGYLIAESSQDLSKRSVLKHNKAFELLKASMENLDHSFLPAVAVTIFSSDVTAAAADATTKTTVQETKYCIVKPVIGVLKPPVYEVLSIGCFYRDGRKTYFPVKCFVLAWLESIGVKVKEEDAIYKTRPAGKYGGLKYKRKLVLVEWDMK
eukprot:GHVS01093775.1.p1 GENE.GHVS01093775.1~~GHVS01093775.1.p1  ORF type:complete len:191 (+),score=20.39 GHVS01093775.1:370-942(+)